MPEQIPSSVLGLYDGIFYCYDAANTFLTFGLDRVWRRAAARRALASSPARVLDVCCGTGALTAELQRLSRGSAIIAALDFSEAMLSRARLRPRSPEITFVNGDAARLPFPDSSFDALTISFATRNLAANGGDLKNYFSEFRRVLRPGGVFVHLETSRPANRFIRLLFRAYTGAMTAAVKFAAPGGSASYSFLSASIAAFHAPEELSGLLLSAGFLKVSVRPLMFGAAAIHTAEN